VNRTLAGPNAFLFAAALAFVILLPTNSAAGKKKPAPRGMIESMQSLPCGVKQKGLNGIGAVWGSIGVTSVSSNEKLCPQYLFRTDQLEYHIRPTDSKHPALLPIGSEAEFKVKKDKLFLKVPDGDHKTRTYQVVSMEPTKSARGDEDTSYHPAAGSSPNTAAGMPASRQPAITPQPAANPQPVNPAPVAPQPMYPASTSPANPASVSPPPASSVSPPANAPATNVPPPGVP